MIFVAALCLLVAVTAGDERCGVPPVISGPEVDPIPPEHVPWVGHIFYEKSKSRGCLASLIGPNFAVTVGYCIENYKPNYITFPYCDKNVTPDCKFEVESAIIHPNYTRTFSDYNLAVLYLKNSVSVSSYFCIPDVDFDSDTLIGKDTFVVAPNFHEKGTEIYSGKPKFDFTLRRTYVTSKNECKEIYKEKPVHEHAVCASGKGVEPCYGTAAAPLIERDVDGRWTLRGVLDVGSSRCADSPEPAVYMNVNKELFKWISN